MKFPKTFRIENLDDKTRQLLDYAKEIPEEPNSAPPEAERAYMMAKRLGFGKGLKIEDSERKFKYELQYEKFQINYVMHKNPKSSNIVETETYVFRDGMLLLRATNNDIDAHMRGDWMDDLAKIYFEYFEEVPEI